MFKRIMWLIGYRRVLWLPSEKGLHMADFWTWEYMPWASKRDYTERDYYQHVGARNSHTPPDAARQSRHLPGRGH